jgi:hypothetical protein
VCIIQLFALLIDYHHHVLISYASFGLKSWEDTPIDIVKDDGCSNMPKVPGLFSVRSPDSIDSHIVGDDTYIIIAEEVRTVQPSMYL